MRRWNTRQVQNERGGVLALTAVLIIGLLAMLALAVDWGMYLRDRNEAQRAADASALAGASVFQAPVIGSVVTAAHDRAMRFASFNTIHRVPIDTATEVTVQVALPDTVRVWVNRPFVRSLFAKVFQVFGVDIGAKAAAVAQVANSDVTCVKPFALPDAWENRNTIRRNETGDTDGDQVWDPNENWAFDTAAVAPALPDRYLPYDPSVVDPTQTGYGSSWRDASGVTADRGRQLIIKAQSPTDALGPGFFYPWRLPGNTGASDYKNSIFGCANSAPVTTGVPYDVETGNMVGPTRQGIDSLISLDPNATWDQSTGTVSGTNPIYGAWQNSPRVIKVGIFDPHLIIDIHDGGHAQIAFNNYGLLFLEGFQGNGAQSPLVARFLYYISGTGSPSGGTATFVRVLRLVE